MGDTTESLFNSENPRFIMDFAGILKVLPHRYPFLLVDGIVAFDKGKSITGQKNVSFNEPFFSGHFPSEPVMPGVLQIEALAQISCILVALSYPEESAGKRPAFAGIEEARFRKPVRPGHVLTLIGELDKYRRGYAVVKTRAEIDGDLVAEAIIKASMI
ncbi:MAG: putative (3R)-hydroxymyristoyl-[acyl carrier protein] dehydratase [Fibrobacteres bacterium]|nr:putative (3R)-hydroxymyristoyl-[acyl carrier protein] dehydratase [Fibrobacterota bacterium]